MPLLTKDEIVKNARNAAVRLLAETKSLREGAVNNSYSSTSLLAFRRLLRESLKHATVFLSLESPQDELNARVVDAPDDIVGMFVAAQASGEAARLWIEAALEPDAEGYLKIVKLSADGENYRPFTPLQLASLIPHLDGLVSALSPLE